MSHVIETIPEGAETIGARADDFMRHLAMDATETVGDVATVGHLAIVRGVTREDIASYASEHGDPYVSDSVRSGVAPGDYAIVTDSQGFVYGFRLPGDTMADLAFNAAEAMDAAFEDEGDPAIIFPWRAS